MNQRLTVRTLCVLVIGGWLTIAGSTAIAQRSDDTTQLRNAFAGALQAQDWTRAAEVGEQLFKLERNSTVAYNIACALARKGEPAAAADWLVKSGEAGFQGASLIRTDTDLDSVRSQPAYAKAVEIISANRAKVFEKFTAEHADHNPRVVLPKNYDASKKYPLIIALHGSGGTPAEMEDLWKWIAAKHDAILCVPSGMRPAGGGFHWMFMDESEWLILHALEVCKRDYAVDESRAVLAGFSQGGNMTFYVTTRQPELFAGAIAIAAHYEPNVQPLPDPRAPKMPRYAILVGANDEGAEPCRGLERELHKIGVPVLLKVYPRHGHSYPPNHQRELDQALRFVLGDK